MLRAHAELTRALDAQLAREHELPLSSYEVLLFLADAPDGRMRMSDLAESVLLSRSGLTRLVDRLEHEGLLKRERCESDARGLAHVELEALDLGNEAAQGDDRRRPWAARAEAERVRHHRAHRKAAEDGALRREAILGEEFVEPPRDL